MGRGLGGSRVSPGRQPHALGGPGHPIGVPSQGQPFLTAGPLGIRGVWLQQLPGLPVLVPWVPEGVKRREEKQRKKTEGWERAARSGAVCTGSVVSSACLFLLHKHFCQNESQAAEHAVHTHTRCLCRSRMHSPILKCFPVAPFLFHLLPVSPCATNGTRTPEQRWLVAMPQPWWLREPR